MTTTQDTLQTRYSEPGAPLSGERIPLCVPCMGGGEWAYIKECLDTNWVSSVGPFVDRFEQELARYVGTKYAVATCNGTSALHLALLAAGIEPEDEVLVSTLTFIAPVNAVRYAGAWPVFIDAEPDYWQMDPRKAVEFLETRCEWRNGSLRNKATGRRVKGILPVHILGHAVDLDPITAVARKYDLTVIEDATEGLGARYKGKMLGTLGDIACFSFNGNKIITTGGGGMIVTNSEAMARRAKYLSTQAKDDPIEFVHKEVGYNYRLTNIQAAMGCAQLEVLDKFIAAKRDIAASYQEALGAVRGIVVQRERPETFSTFWLYTALVDKDEFGMDSRFVITRLGELGIQTRPLWQPIHLSPAHRSPWQPECPVAEDLNGKAVSLPCSVGLRPDQQKRVVTALRSFGGTDQRV